jgi:hypothetical protein
MIKLDELMELELEVKARLIGRGPFGTRQLFDILGGEFKGPRLAGRVLSSGGDWMLVGADDVGRLDVRIMLETHDDALIYMQFNGILEVNDRVVAAASGSTESDFDDSYFVLQPRFETGDPHYAWLNRCVGLGEGRVGRNKVYYRIYRAVKGLD